MDGGVVATVDVGVCGVVATVDVGVDPVGARIETVLTNLRARPRRARIVLPVSGAIPVGVDDADDGDGEVEHGAWGDVSDEDAIDKRMG